MELVLDNKTNKMPCHNQQLSGASQQEHAVKQVRFVNTGSGGGTISSTEVKETQGSGLVGAPCPWQLGPRVKLLPLNDQIRELQTIIRDK